MSREEGGERTHKFSILKSVLLLGLVQSAGEALGRADVMQGPAAARLNESALAR